jgi:NAD(P)-dependent dehydrogenase (short-subunit alcohol dehydrogenase family)
MSDRFDLSGKVAVVTGGAQGLGAAIARALVERGAAMTILDVDGERAEATAAEIARDCGGDVGAIACDVSRREPVDATIARVVEMLGRIDILVNNAGIHRRVSPLEFRQEDVDRLLQVNLLGGFYMAGAVGKVMIEQRGGSIINISALGGGLMGLGRSGSIYGVTKGGIVALTRDLAAEWGKHGVRVNAIAPGWIRTPMTAALQNDAPKSAKVLERVPLGRWGRAEEVAAVAVFLASDASAYITGCTIPVDGGAANAIALGEE